MSETCFNCGGPRGSNFVVTRDGPAHYSALDCITFLKLQIREAKRNLPDLITRAVAELPDRDSPDDRPNSMIVTDTELRDIVMEELENAFTETRNGAGSYVMHKIGCPFLTGGLCSCEHIAIIEKPKCSHRFGPWIKSSDREGQEFKRCGDCAILEYQPIEKRICECLVVGAHRTDCPEYKKCICQGFMRVPACPVHH